MSKHTAGPWSVSGKTVYALNGKGVNRFSALVQDAHTGDAELQANARLIAAAPDLLEALGSITEQLEADGFSSGTTYGPLIYSAVAAIAKATGDNP